MNKLLKTLLVVSGFALSGSAMAQMTAFTGSANVTGGAAGQCPLLSETVTLNTSNKVHGAYECDEANSVIVISACHEGGSRQALVCTVVGSDDSTDPPTPIYNNTGCNDTNVGQVLEGQIDYRAFVATTSGGSVAPVLLGGRCDAATIVGTSPLD